MSKVATEVLVCAEIQQRKEEARVFERDFLELQPHRPDAVLLQTSGSLYMPASREAITAALLQQASDYERSKSLLGLLEAVQIAFPRDADTKIKR